MYSLNKSITSAFKYYKSGLKDNLVVRLVSSDGGGDKRPLTYEFKSVLDTNYSTSVEKKPNNWGFLKTLNRKKTNAKLFDVLSNTQKVQKEMPKDQPHLEPLKRKRIFRRSARVGDIPSTIEFMILGNGSKGCARSLYLYTEHQRYLFNASEGVQRLAAEYCKAKSLAQLGHIYVTSRTWQNLGGLGGIVLSVRAAGAPDLYLHGPPGLMEFYQAVKSFAVISDFDVFYHNLTEPDYDENGITINEVPITPSPQSDPVYPQDPKYSKFIETHTPPRTIAGDEINSNNLPKRLYKERVKEAYDRTVVSYIVTCKSKPGRLKIEKCLELGVPPGPLLGELKAGRDIVLDNGVHVKSADVMEEPTDPSKYIIIEIPGEEYLDSLENENQLNVNHGKDFHFVQAIFHFTPSHVMKTPRYLRWMNSFSSSVQHILLNDINEGSGSHDLISYNQRLHYINPFVFTQLEPDILSNSFNLEGFKVNGVLVSPVIGQMLQVRPQLNELRTPTNGRLGYKEEIDANQKAVELIANLKTELPEKIETEYPIVTFLGTGSSVPSKYRCVSAILVETAPDNFILLDCGEGTIIQMHIMFGRERTMEILRSLKAIYVSHLHADHHMGFINVVQNRERAFSVLNKEVEKLYVLCPHRMSRYLNIYHWKVESILQDLVHVKNEYLVLDWKSSENKNQVLHAKYLEDLCRDCGFQQVVTCRADHCASAFIILMTLKSGYKFIYSGDTRPTPDLENLAEEFGPVDLLIHEATMEHYLLADAKSKKHSTITEAIEVGKKIKAGFTILTHFSQRYAKIPAFDELEGQGVGVAWDYMQVNPKTFHLIEKSFPALKEVFNDSYIELIDRRTINSKVPAEIEMVLEEDPVEDDNLPEKKSKLESE